MVKSLQIMLAGALVLCTSTQVLAKSEEGFSGPYVGIHAGGQTLSDHYYGIWKNTPPIPWDVGTNVDAGFVGGFHAGYEKQRGRLVLGGEADVEVASANVPFGDSSWTYSANIPIQGSLRARVGLTSGQTLFYTTGGIAVAQIKNAYYDSDPLYPVDNKLSRVNLGYTVGMGFDHFLNSRVTARIEYRFTDFGKLATDVNSAWNEIDINRDKTHAVRVGVSLHL